MLSLVPQAEKFAKFWICQAKLLARSGPFNVLQLYREAVSAGAEVSVPCLCSGRLPQDPGARFWNEFSLLELPVPFHAAGCAHAGWAPGQLCWVLMDPTGQRGILQPLLSSAQAEQQKPFLPFISNSGLHSHARPALTHVLLFLQPVEELRASPFNILKDAGQKLEGNLSIVASMSMGRGTPWCCQPGGNTVHTPSQHLVSLLRSVVKVWNPDLKNGTLFFCLG